MSPGMSSSSRRPRYDSMRSSTSDVGWRPPSPTFSTTTTGSRVNAPAGFPIISRKDLRQSIACLEELMAAAKAYRNALLAMSEATAAFAQAMEACSRVKGCREANSSLSGASALQHLLANHDQLLADTVYRQFEIPLLSALDEYKLLTADRLASYEKSLSDQSAKIRRTEAQNLRDGRRRKRDLNAFRAALVELQRQVEELDGIKMGYHEEVLEAEGEMWDTVLSKVAFVIRSQLDFYEKIASKATDPILEPLVMSIPDPFNSYGPPKEDGQIFSVLAPLGMLDSTPGSPTPALTRSHTSPTPKSPSASASGSRSSSNGKNPTTGASGNTSGRASPNKSYGALGSTSKGVPFPSMSMSLSMSPSRARAEIGTTTISALGFNAEREIGRDKEGDREGTDGEDGAGGTSEEVEDGVGGATRNREASSSRARRELSVIEERANEALSPTKSVMSSRTIPIPTPIDTAPLANSGPTSADEGIAVPAGDGEAAADQDVLVSQLPETDPTTTMTGNESQSYGSSPGYDTPSAEPSSLPPSSTA